MIQLSWGSCVTWKAPEELTQGHEERLHWELRSFDLIDWKQQPCQHRLSVELKPMLSKWYVQYYFDSLPELRKKYESLDEFSRELPKDLNQLMGTYQSSQFSTLDAKYSQNSWQLLKPNEWPLFEVGLFSETRQFGDRAQTFSGIEFAITRSLASIQSEINTGFAYQGSHPNSDQVWLDWKAHLGIDLEYSIWEKSLQSPTLNTGFSLQGFWTRTPKDWKGEGLDLVPEATVGLGFRGFRAHSFNLAILSKLHLPTGNIQVLDVEEGEVKEYYPLGFSIQTQIGF